MNKIKFDLSFLEDTQAKQINNENKENNKIPNYEGHNITNTESESNGPFKIFIICIIAAFVGFISWNIYIEISKTEKARKIKQLEEIALQYKRDKDPLLNSTLTELSKVKEEDVAITAKAIEEAFYEEKNIKIDSLVNYYIENGSRDSSKEKEYIRTYYNDKQQEFEKDFKDHFQKIKSSYALKIINVWKNNVTSFENKKKIYIKTLFNGKEKDFNEALDKVLGYKNFTLVEKSLPKSGVIKNYTRREAVAPFKIITSNYSDDENYYIKLVDSRTDHVAETIFVRSGDTVEVKVPVGSYKIRYATGHKWYGEEDLFGHETSYAKSNELLVFSYSGYYVSGMSLTLYKTRNGNFATNPMKAEDF